MAVQYQVAHSADISGVAVFAGGPFYCAQGQLVNAFEICMNALAPINLDAINEQAQNFAENGLIDDLSNIESHEIFLFSGTNDWTVRPSVVQALQQQYSFFNATNINTEYTIGDAHGFPTVNFGVLCALQESPFINNCNSDGAGFALATIYGPIKPAGTANPNGFLKMEQAKFTPNNVDPASLSLDKFAYAYTPKSCVNGGCPVHIVLHGCQQNYQTVGNVFIVNAGYNEWAETNGIIIVYPQTITSFFAPMNPEGCWDWWGYLTTDYATKNAPQIVTIYNIATALSKPSFFADALTGQL